MVTRGSFRPMQIQYSATLRGSQQFTAPQDETDQATITGLMIGP